MFQFFLMNAALKSDEYFLYGFQVLTDLLVGKQWTKSGHFPRVTLCDFEVRYLANLNRYTVQCALLINIINEKVFTFFWLWYCLLLCATTCSALFWLGNSLLHAAKVDYVLKFMQIAEHNDRMGNGLKQQQQQQQRNHGRMGEEGELLLLGGGDRFRVPSSHALDNFVEKFLKSDGLFILRLVANNAGELVVVSIVRHLWREFSSRHYSIRPFLFENSVNNRWEQQQQQQQHQQQHQTGPPPPPFLSTMNSTRLGNGPSSSQSNLFGQTKSGGIHLILDKRRSLLEIDQMNH